MEFRLEKALQAPSELDRCIRLEKLCGLKKKFTSIGPPNAKLSTSKDFQSTKTWGGNE